MTGVAVPLDPQIRALLERGTGVPLTHTLSVAEARRQYEARVALMAPPAAVRAVHDRVVAGPGGPLRLRLYEPEEAGPWPVLVFFHGGGFVLCSLETHDGTCRNLCAGAGCLVASVEYRLAPEHRFPAPTDDCLHATRWVAEHAASLGADPARVAVGGDSAGGNYAAVTALRVRDEGGPPLFGQLLIYPVTDHYAPGTPSYAENGSGYGLTRETMAWFWDHYLPSRDDAANPYAAPLRAPRLDGLPPCFIATAEFDPLRDEGERYAERLRDAGVPVTAVRYQGMNHGFLFWVGVVDAAARALDDATEWLRRASGAPSGESR